ncbi:hypothetical protein CAPTEDRAFT_218290 [Capitella teleta]|uniref:G-protein coupled receptors family 1 profile domain-containing protein n=1 Tax=Capitella teleta TaxID=283909 RepID=R7U4H2_CAPTE|nr:hypothetical protein CAPTEDRAFT_218290 [Capitella teleta]|eukprot:ELT98586.1 hypothetical protein CAPTEDRAFT_218290 [Capitella teleta]
MRLLFPLVALAAIAVGENSTNSGYNSAESTESPEPETNSTGALDSVYTKLLNKIRFYGFNVIGVLAVTCNGLNIWVLQKKRVASPYIYMTALAISDLLTGLCILMNTYMNKRDLLGSHAWLRKVSYHVNMPTYYIRFSLATYSTYLLNTLSIDRLIAVKFPMHHPVWCTSKRTRVVCAALVLFCVVFNIHFLLRFHMLWVNYEGVTLPVLGLTTIGRNPTVNASIMYFKLLFQQLVPLALMFTTNIWTINEIIKGIKFRRNNTSGKQQKVQCLGVTLGVITVFILTNSPAIFNSLSNVIDPSRQSKTSVLYLFELLRWISIISNFFFYVILDKRFRDDVINIFLCRWGANPKPEIQSKTSDAKM